MLRPISDLCFQALAYAYRYKLALYVWEEGATVLDDWLWYQKSFEQRVKNFDWDDLPSPKQYEEMAKELVNLLEIVERAWGGSADVLEKVAARWVSGRKESGKPLYQTIGKLKRRLQEKVEELRRCNFKEVTPPGQPS